MPMTSFTRLLLICLIAFPATALPKSSTCASVREVKSNPKDFLPHSVRIKAFLGYTGHGFYLVDDPKGSELLRVSFPNAGPHANAGEEIRNLVFKCGFASNWAPVGGVYEGELSSIDASNQLVFEIHSHRGGNLVECPPPKT